MSRILVAVMVVAALFGVGVVAVRQLSEVSHTVSERSPEDRTVQVDRTPVTCRSLVPEGCDFDLQHAFDRWGGQIGVYAASDLGPWGRGLGPAAAVTLGLRACDIASTPGKTFLEFVEVGRATHPEASSPQLFPLWQQAQRLLCPS